MAASLRNAVKRKTHKERSQPVERSRYGLLEKKKDYVVRAKDYHKKEETIKSLRQKAASRNPDEFYFAMEKARTRDGVHVGRQEESNKYTPEELRLMKTQDAGYLKMKAQAERKVLRQFCFATLSPKRSHVLRNTEVERAYSIGVSILRVLKVERIASNLHLLRQQSAGKHTIFVEDGAQAAAFDAAKHFNTPAELLDRAFNRPTVTQLREQASVPATAGTEAAMRKRAAKPPSGYRELVARTNRLKTLTSALDAAEAEKANMGKGRKRKVAEALRPKLGQLGLDGQPEDGDGGRGAKQPAVFKWKTERKR